MACRRSEVPTRFADGAGNVSREQHDKIPGTCWFGNTDGGPYSG
jgi:hypothetical protein